MIVDASTELRTQQDNSDVADDNFFDPHKVVVDLLANGIKRLSSGVQTFLTSLTPVNQELHVMPQILPPSLPPMFEGKLPLDKLVCDKCDAEQTVNKIRRGACKSWRGGKRGALKKSESTKKDKQYTVNRGRKPKQTQPAATDSVDCSNLFISSEDALSPLTAVPNVNDESIDKRIQLIGRMTLLIQCRVRAMMNALNCSKWKMILTRILVIVVHPIPMVRV
jgi:hypothetical protein